jgi:hypothetical protein
MPITAFKGPVVSYGAQPFADGNEFEGPDVHNAGMALQDPRPYCSYAGGNFVVGWLYSGRGVMTIDATPAASNATCIAATQSPGAATVLTLASAANASAQVAVNVSVVNVNSGAVTTGAVAINCPDATSTSGFYAFGQAGVAGQSGVNIWGPDRAYGRCLLITSGGNDSGKTVIIRGADPYGVDISQTVSLANTSAVATTKAFKYIYSATLSSTAGTSISIGFGTVFGLPIRADNLNYCDILHGTSSGTAITAAITSSATALTGDVRGTFIAAVTGTSQLTVYQSTTPAQLSTQNALLGVPQA